MSKLYSSVNTRITTINNCEEEPINIPGSIQPHGFLFVINKDSEHIALCSANTADFLLEPPMHFLSKPCREVLPDELIQIVTDEPSTNIDDQQIPITLSLHGKHFACFRRITGLYILLECILTTGHQYGIYELFDKTNNLLKATDEKTTLLEFCNLVAEKIRYSIGFDRVMIYRFDKEYNGQVFAESVGEGIDSFLGLHYPHTDIPKQARALYLKNKQRLIPDIHYEAIPIVTLEMELASPETIDLSEVQIRSVSPIHITYLKNMNIGASMSISIIKRGKLWGLIACHHTVAKPLSYMCQIQAYLLAQVLSSQISVQESTENNLLVTQLDVPLKTLMEYLKREENFIELHFGKLEEIINIVNASGVVLIYKNRIYTNGIVPPTAFILALQKWLEEQGVVDYHTEELYKHFPAAIDYMDISSGLLYQQLSRESKTSLFWFRQSSDKVITWAGNPYSQKELSPLSPRNSFAAWQEIKKGISAVWEPPELNSAFRFSYLLQQHILNLLHREDQLKNRKLTEQLLKANKELENINWISTHDLKEPLRKIQVFASMLDASSNIPKIDTINHSIEKIRSAAVKMQQFIDDLLVYSQMSGMEMAYETIDLNTLVSEVMKDFKEEAEQNLFELTIATLPVIQASRFQMKQLFVNLVANAIKFKKESEIQKITISCETTSDLEISADEKKEWYKISISDRGIGFTDAMTNSIFDIFKKGHSDGNLKGTGIGLSICRKIMENHGGKITATGVEDVGAVFTLFFPIVINNS